MPNNVRKRNILIAVLRARAKAQLECLERYIKSLDDCAPENSSTFAAHCQTEWDFYAACVTAETINEGVINAAMANRDILSNASEAAWQAANDCENQ